MPECSWIEPIVEKVVAEVLINHSAQLRGDIARRVSEEVAAQPGKSVGPKGAAELAHAISEIQTGSSQKEILRALLDSTSRYATRVALFVVKGNQATGWQARGFRGHDAVKDFVLDSNAPAVVRALADQSPVTVVANEFDAHFIEAFGAPANLQLFPLILKDKVAALVYADDRSDGTLLDAGSIEVLVLATGAWLEVTALRKQAHKEPSGSPADGHPVIQKEPPSQSAFNDPFAAHAPVYAMAAAASSGSPMVVKAIGMDAAEPTVTHLEPDVTQDVAYECAAAPKTAPTEVQSAAAAAVMTEISSAEPLAIGEIQAEVVSSAASPAAPAMSPEDAETHSKARRFARLLVDEIKLYNQAKVTEGRAKKDLYDRLREPIDKSRATYQKRYGSTVAASGNYFEDEIKRSLAEDDLSNMGPNFRM
ncbi:MAG: hypothetical protein WBQ72_02135 [Terriglobales bacterium]|jgi:hypothetical protein